MEGPDRGALRSSRDSMAAAQSALPSCASRSTSASLGGSTGKVSTAAAIRKRLVGHASLDGPSPWSGGLFSTGCSSWPPGFIFGVGTAAWQCPLRSPPASAPPRGAGRRHAARLRTRAFVSGMGPPWDTFNVASFASRRACFAVRIIARDHITPPPTKTSSANARTMPSSTTCRAACWVSTVAKAKRRIAAPHCRSELFHCGGSTVSTRREDSRGTKSVVGATAGS
mmetsp:Transcript_18770/g.38189  ORF Transcript_18770/g.38189 Transcript_18770/m.38189 type:complete len:226 (+) Transcript_18770:73-750(+)